MEAHQEAQRRAREIEEKQRQEALAKTQVPSHPPHIEINRPNAKAKDMAYYEKHHLCYEVSAFHCVVG